MKNGKIKNSISKNLSFYYTFEKKAYMYITMY